MIKVLVVEDDPMVAYLNQRYIDSVGGFTVVKNVGDGETALEILRQESIDLVILDIYMPKINGLELLEEIRKRFLQVDVILVTAAKELEVIDKALKLGAVDYLIKPFKFERLKDALEKYRNRYKFFNEEGSVSQEDIDRLTKGRTSDVMRKKSLPKGLHAKTLERIRKKLQENNETFLNVDEIAEKAGISRVTARRYLEYLESIGAIEFEVEYGNVGRPSYVYRLIKE
jgi:response regulator of citrate/malate metabolism